MRLRDCWKKGRRKKKSGYRSQESGAESQNEKAVFHISYEILDLPLFFGVLTPDSCILTPDS